MKRFICFLLALTMLTASTGITYGATSGPEPSQTEQPAQSDTEFIVALDPAYAERVVAGEAELFTVADKTDKKEKKLPPGLLKKGTDAKDVHIRNIERYMEKHMGDSAVLVTVEVADTNKMQEARAAVEACEGVLYTDPLAYYYADTFTDPRAPEQWGLTPIDAYDAWNGNSALSGVTIAVLDTGVRMTHEDLAASIVPGWDFIGNDPDPTDENGHGTHVAGIAAALSDNGKGIASPAGGAKIMPVRVLNAKGSGDVLSISDGIRYAADHGADILNMSFGGLGQTVTMRLAVEYALSKGCLIVAAAGNNNSELPHYPAANDGVLVAASLSALDNPEHPYAESHFSNYCADYADRIIHAPGEDILSTYYSADSSYGYMTGTSMAAPYLSGIAAALKARGGYNGTLFDAVLDASATMPRAMQDSAGEFSRVSGQMRVLNDDGQLSLPSYSGQLALTLTPNPARGRTVQAGVRATTGAGLTDTAFNGTVELSFVCRHSMYAPAFGDPRFTTFTQPVELTNGAGTVELDLAGYNHNDYIYLWATDPAGRYAMSAKATLPLYNSAEFKGCNIEITLDKPDSYTGPASLPTGSEAFELQIYVSYFDTMDSNQPPAGMSSAGASMGRLKWDPVALQYRGTINLPRGKVQLYYYVYYNGLDFRYPDPQPIGQPILLMGDTSVTGKLLPYDRTVTFVPNGGTPAPVSQALPEGGRVTPPATINKEGYTFAGWYADPAFAGAPYDFTAPITSSLTLYAKWVPKQPGFRIGEKVYQTLAEAIAAAKSGDTITLLSDILYHGKISISGKQITFDLAGHTLDVVSMPVAQIDTAPALLVQNGAVRLTGDGEFNVKSTVSSGDALQAVNSVVEITNAVHAGTSAGVRAEDNSVVTVRGSARGMYGVDCVRGSSVTVYGDAIGFRISEQNRSRGVHASINGTVVVYGDVFADDAIHASESNVTVYGDVYGDESYYSSGIEVLRSGNVTVFGNVTTGMGGVRSSADGKAAVSVTIHGNLTSTHPLSVGVVMGNTGTETVVINGTVNAPAFAKIFGVSKTAADITAPTTKAGYWTYDGTKDAATATLWVKNPDAVVYTVSFVPNGGAPAPAEQTVERGTAAALPAVMTKAGYDFGGWYTTPTFTGAAYAFGTALESNLTLYAKWTPTTAKYTVSFVPNGGAPAPAAQTVPWGNTAAQPAAMTRAGYTFAGWYLNPSFTGSAYVFETAVVSDLTLYAKWNVAVLYTVSFAANGGAPVPAAQFVAQGTCAVQPAPMTKANSLFKGWYTTSGFTGQPYNFATPVNANLTLYAKWAAAVTVSFSTAGGSACDPILLEANAPYGAGTLPTPVRSGYAFDGWYLKSNLKDKATETTVAAKSNHTLYAKWTPVSVPTYTVTFLANGGTPAPAAQKLTQGGTATQPAAMTRAGYDFGGWYTNASFTGSAYAFGTAVTSDLTLYAKWTAVSVPTYTITFVPNGGTPAPTAQKVTQGGAATQPAAMTRAGYDFGGWYTNAGFTGSAYVFGTAVTSDLTLYAKWTAVAAAKYSVTFTANGGAPAPAAQSVTQGALAVEPAPMTKAKSIFKGWYTTSGFSGQPYSFSTPISTNLNLYAKWATAVTVSFNTGGGSVCDSILTEVGMPYENLPVPVRSGYVFDGWCLKSNLKDKVTATTVADKKDHTLYAAWKPA